MERDIVKLERMATSVEPQEATFTIKWNGSLGRNWMNIDNLKACLFSKVCIGGKVRDKVEVKEV